MSIRVSIRSKSSWKTLQLYYDDPVTGREVSKSAGTADRDEALKAAGKWEEELLAFRGTRNDGWGYAVERFLEERMASVAPSTRADARKSLKRYLATMKPKCLADVTGSTISQFTASVQGIGTSTVCGDLRSLKTFLRWCFRMKMIAEVPHIEFPKQGKRRFMRGRPLTHPEYLAMVKHAAAACGEAAAASWRRLLELLWLSGLRIEEASVLSWDSPPVYLQIDAKPYPQILFYGADGGQKSRNDEAWIVPPDLAAWLRKTPAKRRQGLVAPLLGYSGEPLINRADVSKAVARIGVAAGIVVSNHNGQDKHASAHDLRRSFGTRWALQVPPVVLQRMMRHATIDTTMKYYVGLDVSQIGAVLWKTMSPEMSPGRTKKRTR